jgi:hypothetical protein
MAPSTGATTWPPSASAVVDGYDGEHNRHHGDHDQADVSDPVDASTPPRDSRSREAVSMSANSEAVDDA